MSVRRFGTIHLIAGAIAIFIAVILFISAPDARYLDFDDIGEILLRYVTAYLALIFGFWGLLVGGIAVVLGGGK